MKQLNFSIDINATKEKVWQVLWDAETYPKWTAVFGEGSQAVSDWEEGSRILFLSAGGGGMFSRIEKKIPNEVMNFTHLGMMKDGIEQPETEETKAWSGVPENYRLTEKDGVTTLTMTMDIPDAHATYFEENFPKAFEAVKGLAEK